MKKISTLVVAIILVWSSQTKVQAQAFEKDKNYFSFSYGFGAFYTAFFSSVEESIKQSAGSDISISTSSLGPLSFKYERAVSDKVGLGLSVNYLSNTIKYTEQNVGNSGTATGNYNLNRTTLSILARMNLHFGDNDKFDPYWGLGIGYRTVNWKQTVSYSDGSTPTDENDLPTFTVIPFGFETVFGARYFLGPNFALFGELGLAKSVLQLGVTGKF